jgi:hypothetical protein
MSCMHLGCFVFKGSTDHALNMNFMEAEGEKVTTSSFTSRAVDFMYNYNIQSRTNVQILEKLWRDRGH